MLKELVTCDTRSYFMGFPQNIFNFFHFEIILLIRKYDVLNNKYSIFYFLFFFSGLAILTGFKRGRIVTRARSVFVRFFEVICNCTNASTIPSTTPLDTNTKT